MQHISRRQFLYGSAAAMGSLTVGRSLLWADDWAAKDKKRHLPKPDKSGIKHVVVVMMENRSFDHLLGWLPGADGKQAGLTFTDSQGTAFQTYPLAPDYQGCGHPDPDHSYDGGRVEFDNGLCDGWLRAGSNDIYSIGYYTQADLPFLGKAALDWTVCNRYFAPIMAPTYPNRIYQHAALTDRLDDSTGLCTLPTIWDRLDDAGLNGRYYFNDVPFIALWGTKYASISRTYDQFLQDCASGSLPEVSFVDPPFYSEDAGTSSDDHPHGDIRAGESFLNQTYQAVTTGAGWKNTVMVINFDEWGGFFEHVAPDQAPDVDSRFALRGFRVPCLLVSPFAAPRAIAQGVYDHTSILRMIEWRWSLPPLSVRDAAANNLAEALDFKLDRHTAPAYAVPAFTSVACPSS
ncbi:MAG TPA: alkaline phosphatase family protein [Thermoanaerobaculia bacterium]